MLRTSLIVIIAVLAGLVVLALLLHVGRRHAEGSALIAWRHVIAAAVALIVFVSAAVLFDLGRSGAPSTDYQPPRIENGQIKPGEFKPVPGPSAS